MDFLLGVQGVVAWAFHWVLPFVGVLSAVVVVHELGHFLMGRLFGTRIDSFSLGFGPEMFSVRDGKGTKWRVAWLPLGGYVKFFGDMGAASAPDSEQLSNLKEQGVSKDEVFHFKPLYQRALIVVAGPIANFILAIVVFASILMFVGEVQITPRIDAVDADGAGAVAGFEPGDIIVRLQNRNVDSFRDVQRVVNYNADVELTFVVERQGELIELFAIPREQEITDQFDNTHKVGILGLTGDPGPEDVRTVRFGPPTAIWMGTVQTYDLVAQTFIYLGRVISGRQSADQLGGPLRIAQISGQVASVDMIALIRLIAILSVSIGLINLFPVPILDGGHLLFYAYEAVIGKPLGEGAQEVGFRLGLVAVLALMIFATWNDLVQLRVFEFLEGMFS